MTSTTQLAAKDHPIKSVTVFKSSKAEVVRTFSVALKAGQNKIEIKGLSSSIDTRSVRVSGLGEARLFDVVCTVETPAQNHDASSEAIRLLQARKLAFESEKRVREHEADLLVNYAKTLTGEHITPGQMSQFLETFVTQGRKNLEAVTALDEEIVKVERLIEKEKESSLLQKGQSNGQARIVLGVEEKCNVEFKLTYIVSNASWEPTYELHATTSNGKPSTSVSLHYRARITQSTGENWTDTSLTLSTVASETFAKNIPRLVPIKIRPHAHGFKQANRGGLFGQQQQQQQQQSKPVISMFGQPQQQLLQQQQTQQQQVRGGLFGGTPAAQPPPSTAIFGQPAAYGASSFGTAPATTGLFGSSAGGPPPAFGFGAFGSSGGVTLGSEAAAEPATDAESAGFEEIAVPGAEPSTIVSESPLAISYSVEGNSTIPTDGVAHQVTVAVLPFQAQVTYVSIPRVDPRVFLQSKVKNTSDYRLLPGFVTVILDDSFVSTTSIQDINKGDTFDCTLGVDNATKVMYSRTHKTVRGTAGAFAEVINTTTYTTKITIHNKHVFAIPDLIVRDIIPISDDKRIKVLLRKPDGLADSKDGQTLDKADGLKIRWQAMVDGKGGEKEGKFEWVWNVDAGAQIKLDAEWEVKAPSDLPHSEFADVFGGF